MNRKFLLILFLVLMASCGSEQEAGTGVSNPPSASTLSTNNAAAAVGTVFANSTNVALNQKGVLPLADLIDLFVKSAVASDCPNDPGCICNHAQKGDIDLFGIEAKGFQSPGTFGSFDTSINVPENGFCFLSDGTINTGSGPDGKGRFAGFKLTRDIPGSCQSGKNPTAVVLHNSSTGVWRVTTEETSNGTTKHLEIYGQFVFTFDGVESTAQCTVIKSVSASAAFLIANCTQIFLTLPQDSSATCRF